MNDLVNDLLDEALIDIGVNRDGAILVGWRSAVEKRLVAAGIRIELLLACCADNIVEDDESEEDIDRGRAIDEYWKSVGAK